MRVVIAGGGRVGGALAARLVADRHAVTVIDRDVGVLARLAEEFGVVTIVGDASDARVLESAGIAGAQIAAGVLARDADNLAFAALSRVHSGARVMVRMLDARYREAYRLAGVRDVIEEADLVVGKLATAIEFPEVTGSLPLASGDALLFELVLKPRAAVTGLTVAQVRQQEGFPRDCLFIGLVAPDGSIELPTGQSQLRGGHTAILVTRRAELGHAIACLTREAAGAPDALSGLVATLRRVDFLAPLSDDELGDIARGIELQRFTHGQPIFAKGAPGDRFYLVLAGRVAIGDDAARPTELVERGGFFGEVSLLTGEPRWAAARAATDVELAAIGRDDFQHVLLANPVLGLEMSRLLGRRLAATARGAAPKKGLFSR